MKLSWRIFFVAYIMVLLSMGIGGFMLVKSSTDTIWDERVQRCKAAHTYAVNSFYSLSDVIAMGDTSSLYISRTMKNQIEQGLDGSVTELKIFIEDDNQIEKYADIADNSAKMKFSTENNRSVLEIGSRVCLKGVEYIVVCRSDFSTLTEYNSHLWTQYRITVLLVSVLCGGLLFIFAKRLTKPLTEMSDTAKSIAEGNYGLCITVRGGGEEIKSLSENFNTMSVVVADALDSVREECRRRDTFVADFAHELKTPVTSIIGYADMLGTYELSEEERMQAAHSVYREAKRLEKLSMQLLELIVTTKERPQLSAVSLSCVGKAVRDTMVFSAKKYGVTLVCSLGESEVLASEPMLLSLLYNLADNALKASSVGGEVKIYSEDMGDSVRITVSDKGHGISGEHLKHITEPFYREDKSRARSRGGVGLGLALCKEICSVHSTELSVESEKNKGTTVSFVLRKPCQEGDCNA